MALPHASPGTAVDVQPLGPTLQTEISYALFKSRDLEVIRLILLAGKEMPPHKVDGEITLQCIEGRIEVKTHGAFHTLAPGQLLFLARDDLHAVRALEDSSALLTIALRDHGKD